jgi:cytochrome c6
MLKQISAFAKRFLLTTTLSICLSCLLCLSLPIPTKAALTSTLSLQTSTHIFLQTQTTPTSPSTTQNLKSKIQNPKSKIPSALFSTHCSGCHINGSNIIRRGKNLKLKTLEKNGYATTAAIADIITHGKGNMSAYSDRLSAEEIEAIAAYVLDQAQHDWKS